MMIKVADLEVYENLQNNIVIKEKDAGYGVVFDASLAEYICKAIKTTAKQIRERENENE